jgi:ABC-type transport system involved in cytochrome c biogenesis permease subunit
MNWFSASESAFKAAVGLYLAGTALYLVYLARRQGGVGLAATGVTAAAVALHTAGLAFRWIQGGIDHPPFTNLYESLLFFSWGIAAFYLVMEWRYKFRAGGAFILPVALGAMGAAVLNPDSSKEIQNLMPALQSHWLHAHVAIAATAYAAFVGAFGAALMFLIKDGVGKNQLGLWANAFMAFMLLISDRLHILTHRVFVMKLAGEKLASEYMMPVSSAGKLLLLAIIYFVIAGALYYLSGPPDESAPEKTGGRRRDGATGGWVRSMTSLAPAVTALGVAFTGLGFLALVHASRLAPAQLAAAAAGMGLPPDLAAAIVADRLHVALFGYPFKIIILGLVAFVGAATVLIDLRLERIREFLPDAPMLDSISYTIITIAFPLMTMVIVTGAVWAKHAFGHYWQWDPKETASLICWLIYTAYLHTRISLNWSPRRVAVISIIGFASVVFTYLGVNVIGPGYHAYASF